MSTLCLVVDVLVTINPFTFESYGSSGNLTTSNGYILYYLGILRDERYAVLLVPRHQVLSGTFQLENIESYFSSMPQNEPGLVPVVFDFDYP